MHVRSSGPVVSGQAVILFGSSARLCHTEMPETCWISGTEVVAAVTIHPTHALESPFSIKSDTDTISKFAAKR